ncbi:MAG: hypothetical protein ABSB40_04600 [Nitrososphaeria archaeon]|jgi:hypothetical protein
MNNKHSIMALSALIILLAPSVTAFAYTTITNPVPPASDPVSWYKTVNGVLTSDYYTLYPYKLQSLDIGFSKYGELINSTGGGPGVVKVGMQYPGHDVVNTYDQSLGTSRDPFANELVSENYWVNGWLANITYRDRLFEGTPYPAYRVVWAFALYSDGITYGGPWNNMQASPTVGVGGRQTNGNASTLPIQILYDGPRETIALLVTNINDTQKLSSGLVESWPVAQLQITIIFDKAKKEIVEYKDMKLKLETKVLDGLANIQFGDRGEWDLGPPTGPNKLNSYAEFYPSAAAVGLNTVYGADWENVTGTEGGAANPPYNGTTWLLRDLVQSFTASSGQTNVNLTHDDYENTEAVFVNGIYQLPGTNYVVENPNAAGTANRTIYFLKALNSGDTVTVQYKYVFEEFDNDYSLAQIISADKTYVGAVAYWPQVSDWTVNGWDARLTALFNVQTNIMPTEPSIPFVSGEWDIALSIGQSFRGVTVYVLTDNVNGTVTPEGKPAHIDSEVQYQLNEVFNPWDLNMAADKKASTWLEWKPQDESSITLTNAPFLLGTWNGYNTQAERVMDEDNNGALLVRGVDYTISINGTGYATLTAISDAFYFDLLKIEYSTGTTVMPTGAAPSADAYSLKTAGGRYEWIVVGRDAASVDSAGAAMIAKSLCFKNVTLGITGEDMMDPVLANSIPNVMYQFGTGSSMANYKDSMGRAAIKDDWCTRWPITTSNMIGVGGLLANMVTYYTNDFTTAFYGNPTYTPTTSKWYGAIGAISCWSKNAYVDTSTDGYAVISTYQDINGTTFLVVWGLQGRDTYYASQWIYGNDWNQVLGTSPGIFTLQGLNPGTTSLILDISYGTTTFTQHHPVITIVENLGTISEKLPTHPDP